MPKNEKNKVKDNLLLKQLAFFGLVVMWIIAIIFKNQLQGVTKFGVFIVLILITAAGIYWLNRAFFGVNKDKK